MSKTKSKRLGQILAIPNDSIINDFLSSNFIFKEAIMNRFVRYLNIIYLGKSRLCFLITREVSKPFQKTRVMRYLLENIILNIDKISTKNFMILKNSNWLLESLKEYMRSHVKPKWCRYSP